MAHTSVGALRASAAAAFILLGAPTWAQQGDGADLSIVTNVWKPGTVAADDAHLAQLRVVPGFELTAPLK